MAIQIYREPGFGELAGQAFGSGLSSGLQQLAQMRLQELQQRRQQELLKPALQQLGLQGLESLPPQLIGEVLKQRGKQAETERFGQALALLGGAQPEMTSAMQATLQPEEPQQAQFSIPEIMQAAGLQHLINPEAAGVPIAQQPIAQPKVAPAEQLASIAPTLKTITPADVARIAKQAKLSPKQYQELNRMAQENQKAALEERKQRHKEEQAAKGELLQKHKFAKPEIKSARDEATSAKRAIEDLNRMGELEKEGKLDTPGYVEFLKRSGLDIPALLNPGSEEFQKIAANFIGGAKTAIGGRITNFELEQFMKTIPSLSQSPEGRKRVIANLKRINNAKVAYYDEIKKILKEHPEGPPLDLLEEVDDRIGTKLEKISEQFKKDLLKPVPQGQNRLITGLQAAVGSVLGVPGAILGGLGSIGKGLGSLVG